jgi:predicted AlkP superfamily pyrophosphatase or phosphodiesterase
LPALNGPTGRHNEHDDTTTTKDRESFLRGPRDLRDLRDSRRRVRARRNLCASLAAFVLALALACGGVRQAAAPGGDAHPPGSGGVNRPEHRNKPYVVVVSLDGFRPDYLDTFDLPNLRRILQRGARAQAMVPVFPSLTFPNHYSLVTGLLPERHGIVGNSFYDPARGETYALGDQAAVSDGTWYRGEPIWVTAETQGMVAACFFWPGSEAAIKGVRPTFWKPFSRDTPNGERVDGVLEWLRLPDERRPHIITLYFSELDSASHRAPLDSPTIEQAARSLDHTLGLLIDGIDALPVRDHVYLLLTSDHGMVETGVSQTIRLDSLIDTTNLQASFGGPVASLHVKGGPARARQIRDQLSKGLRHGRAYLREDMPARYRYSADPRIGDVVVVMDESWTLQTSPAASERSTERWGMHGWDPALPSMRALFVIAGPGIGAGVTTPEVRNIDVYPLMTELLGLRPAADLDGRMGRIGRMVMLSEGLPGLRLQLLEPVQREHEAPMVGLERLEADNAVPVFRH